MNFEKEPLNARSAIFVDNKIAFEYLVYIGMLEGKRTCHECDREMALEHDSSYTHSYRLRCPVCRKSKPILKGSVFNNPKIEFSEYIYIVYCWLEKSFEFNLKKNSNVSLNSIKRVKRTILNRIKIENSRHKKKIGSVNAIQVDESVVIRGKLIKSPSEMYDTVKKAVWIMGALEEHTRELVLEIVPNRKKETFLEFFTKNVEKGALVKTDGHRSYPYAVAGIEGDHIVVNHQEGFTNGEGYHTNLIECEWSIFKTDITTRKGVPGFAIPGYVEEYMWRRRHFKEKTAEEYRIAFVNLLHLLFENI